MSEQQIVLISLFCTFLSALAAAISAYFSKKYTDCDKARFTCKHNIINKPYDLAHIAETDITLTLENIGREVTEVTEQKLALFFPDPKDDTYTTEIPKFLMAPPKLEIIYRFTINFMDHFPKGFDKTKPENIYIGFIIKHRGKVFKKLLLFKKVYTDKFLFKYNPDYLSYINEKILRDLKRRYKSLKRVNR